MFSQSTYSAKDWSIGLLLGFALCGCGSDPPAPKAQPDPPREEQTPAPEAPAPKDVEPEPEPEFEPDVPADLPPPVAARCKIKVSGGPKLEKAVVKMQSGDLRPGEVEEAGHAVDYDCPHARDRKGVDLIAKLENGKQVHWKDIDVGDDMSGTVTATQSNRGLPELTPEQEELLEEQGFDIAEPAARPVRVKVPVAFWPHKLPWAEIQLKARGKPTQTVVLAGKRSRPLYPGRYGVFIRKDPDGEFESAGTLTIEAGKSHTVKLLKRPLGLDVTSKAIEP